MRRQLERDYGAALVFGGGLRVKTTLDPKVRRMAASPLPSASCPDRA